MSTIHQYSRKKHSLKFYNWQRNRHDRTLPFSKPIYLTNRSIISFLVLLFILYNAFEAVGRFASIMPIGPFSGFQLRLRSSVCYRTPSLQPQQQLQLQPKYQLTGINCTALSLLLQLQSAQPTLLVCQFRCQRIKSQMCLRDRGIEPQTHPTRSLGFLKLSAFDPQQSWQ